ncbi:hypothetical protein F0562_022154 [Nyssa sinensis]|uniref:Stress-response A/B barrel domain-containing protein n=1 Tax=Nyssa sinensis TaxID=561372 RepID=A0A5J5BQ25_9ASTE|nr:hypothetical protein F0562_022154 [Nyssa sinensis]
MGKFRSITLIKLKEGDREEECVRMLEEQAKAKGLVIKSIEIEIGEDKITPEPLRHGFTHILMITFHTKEDFVAYRCDPKNAKFPSALSKSIEDLLIFNYEAVEL